MSVRSMLTLPAMALAALLSGCAVPVQQPVALIDGYFAQKAKTGRIGVVMSELPKPDTEFPGAYCLLCVGIANSVHSNLTTQVKTFSTDDLKPLPTEVAALLKRKELEVVLIDEPIKMADIPDLPATDAPNKSRKDFSGLKSKHQIDRLLVIHFAAAGVWRAYSAYVPTDVPKAILKGHASIIDLGTHVLEWHVPIDVSRATEGSWDEPPKYPGLTNAYYQVLESGKDLVKKPLAP